MFPGGSIIENANIGVHHLIITDEKKRRNENWALLVSLHSGRPTRNSMEMLLSQVYQLLMIDISSSYNDHIFAKVVSLVEVNNHIAVNLVNVVNVTKDRLAHHVLTIDVIVDVLHEGFHLIIIGCFQFLPYGILFHLQVIGVIVGVAEHISQDLDRFGNVVLEGKDVIESVLSGGIGIELSAHIFDLFLKLSAGSALGALKMQML